MNFPELSSFLSNKAIVEFLIHERTDGFWVWNIDQSESPEIDTSFLTILGTEPSKEQKLFIDFIQPDDWKFFLISLKSFIKNPTNVFNIQLRCNTQKGEVRYFRFFGKYDSQEGRGTTNRRIVGGYNDITDEKIKDLKTNRDIAFLEKIVSNESIFILLVDSKAYYTYVNDYYLEFFGWNREDIIGTSSLLGVIDEDFQKCIDAATECQKEPNKKVVVDLTKNIRGSFLTARWEFIGLTDNEGNFEQTLCIGYDITELKKHEEELRKSESQFRLIVENSQEIIYQISKDLLVEYVSPSIKTITGYDQSDIIGLHVKQLVPAWERPLISAAFEKLQLHQEFLDFVELKVHHKNGDILWLKGKIAHLKNDSGKSIGYTGIAADITQLKRKEEELIKSEHRYKQVIKNNSDLLFQLDKNGRFIFLSDSYASIFGIPLDQILHQPFTSILHPDNHSEGMALLENSITNKMSVENFECRLKVANGKYEWFRTNGRALFSEKNEFICFNGLSIHNHEKKLLELELQKTQKAYESASEQARLGNWEFIIETGDIYWSPMIYKIYEIENFPIPSYEKLLNYTDINNGSKLLEEAVNNAIQFGKPYQLDLQIKTPNNNIKWVRVIGEAEFINGKCYRLIGSVQDINSLKENELKLIDTKNYREAIVKTIPDLMFILDKKGVLLEFSAGALEELLLPPESFLGKSVKDVFPAPLAKQILDAVGKAFKLNQVISIEYELPVGLLTNYYEARFNKLNDSQVVALARNMTQKVETEREKENLLNRIQNQNKALQNYAHIISHNLRSLTTNISGITYLLSDEMPVIKKSEYYEYLTKSTDKLYEFIKQISDTSSIFTVVDLELDSIQLQTIVEKTVLNVIADLRLNAIELNTDIPKHLKVKANRDFLDSIILNLLTNAIKYRSQTNKPSIHITAKTEKDFVKLSVTDNGLGIDLEKYRLRIFGMFKTFHKHEQARGLGLFMVKNQIEAMGGSIDVESEVNKGSTFNVYLPRI